MFGRRSFSFFVHTLLVIANFVASSLLYAQTSNEAKKEEYLKVKPNTCVSISEGRNCHANITISWQLSQSASVCLFQEGKKEALKCWTGVNTGDYSFIFTQAKSTTFSLVDSGNEKIMQSDVMSVSWVYKKSRTKRRWRIF